MTSAVTDAPAVRVLPGRPTAADGMITAPRTCGPGTTVDEARAALRDDHLHAVLVVDGGRLLAVVGREDLLGRSGGEPARTAGALAGRTVGPGADLEATRQRMAAERRRRLAVVDDAGRLLGLLCLQRSGLGFCTDAGVRARAVERGR